MYKKITTLLCGVFATLYYQSLSASAFSLYTESNGEAVGNYAAGIAAEARDASTGWYNPAGLALLHDNQLILGGVGVSPFTTVSGNTLYTTGNILDPTEPFTYGETFQNLQGAENAFVPSLHLAHPLGPNTTFGFSIVVPFGLSTNWDKNSAIRYETTYSKLETIDFSPEIGGRFTDLLAVGLGLDLEYADVTFNRMLGAPAILTALDLPPNTLDSASENHGHSFGIGFHAGVLLHGNDEHSRLGINYQSDIEQEFNGYSRLSGRLADPALNAFDPLESNPNAVSQSNQLRSNGIVFPSITTLSGYQDLNAWFALLGSVVYTNWQPFESIKLYNVSAAAADEEGNIHQITVDSVTDEQYQNTWRFAIGANVKLLDNLLLRVGGGFEQTPTINSERDIRLPDADRYAISVGGHYQWRPSLGIDVGYTHLFIEQTTVNKTDPLRTSQFQVNAVGLGHANLVGGQIVWTIDA